MIVLLYSCNIRTYTVLCQKKCIRCLHSNIYDKEYLLSRQLSHEPVHVPVWLNIFKYPMTLCEHIIQQTLLSRFDILMCGICTVCNNIGTVGTVYAYFCGTLCRNASSYLL